jgi:hypothetical protein
MLLEQQQAQILLEQQQAQILLEQQQAQMLELQRTMDPLVAAQVYNNRYS